MKTKSIISTFFLILFIFSLVSCTKLNKSYPVRNYYVFDVERSEKPAERKFDWVLEISNLTISPKYSGREFIYKTAKNEYQTDFYNQFFKSPSSMITVEVINWFKNSGLFNNIVDTRTPFYPQYVLYGNIVEIYGEYTSSNNKAVLSIEFYLVDETNADPEILLNNKYYEEVYTASRSADDLIGAWNKLLEDILIKLEYDLAKLNF